MALGRKDALFAGFDGGGRHRAIMATLIQTAKPYEANPLAWPTDVLECVVAKSSQLGALLPWNWKATKLADTPNTA